MTRRSPNSIVTSETPRQKTVSTAANRIRLCNYRCVGTFNIRQHFTSFLFFHHAMMQDARPENRERCRVVVVSPPRIRVGPRTDDHSTSVDRNNAAVYSEFQRTDTGSAF